MVSFTKNSNSVKGTASVLTILTSPAEFTHTHTHTRTHTYSVVCATVSYAYNTRKLKIKASKSSYPLFPYPAMCTPMLTPTSRTMTDNVPQPHRSHSFTEGRGVEASGTVGKRVAEG